MNWWTNFLLDYKANFQGGGANLAIANIVAV